jgi:hypothetical protein
MRIPSAWRGVPKSQNVVAWVNVTDKDRTATSTMGIIPETICCYIATDKRNGVRKNQRHSGTAMNVNRLSPFAPAFRDE